ncbi:related to Vault poly [Fusarium fujikuroi]|nr:related to Vault poly [Fusarium fujikuroi]
MASRHVFTQRLKPGVIFSAPGNLLSMPEGGWGDDTPIKRRKKPQRKSKNLGLDHFSHWVAKVTPYDEPYDNVDNFMLGKDIRGIGNDYRPYSISPYPEPEVGTASATTSEVTLCLPMLSVSLTATVDGTVAHTELVQKFHNPSDIIIESAKHVFPLYDGAAITSFECTIGDERRVRGVVKPKVQARKEFEEAVRDKVAAPALLEEHTPEIFETSLGNIPADTTVEIKITYVQELKVVMMESEATEGIALTIPMSIAPRYSKTPIEWEPASKVPEEKLDIWIKVADNGKVNHEGCDEESGHLLQFEGSKPVEYSSFLEKDASSKTYYVWRHVSEPAILRKDFVFVIQMKEGHHIKSRAIARHADDNGFAAVTVNIRPNDLFRNAIIPQSFTGELLFLLDQSESMEWSNGSPDYGRRHTGSRKIDVMREAMLLALSGIPSTCVFNIISWGSATMGLWETSRPHTQENIREAKGYVSQVEADMGGTDLLRALESVVKRRVQDRGSTQIIILTDGELEPEESIEFIWKKRQLFGDSIRFFALGIGDEVSHRLVESIAECGGGYSDVVHTTQTPRWHDRLNRLLKSALEPNSWSCDIDLGSQFERKDLTDFKLRDEKALESGKTPYIQAPFPISSLHPFSFASISFLIDLRHGGEPPKTVTISTTTAGAKKKTYELPIETSSGSDGTIHQLVAKSVLLDLQDQIKRGTAETKIAQENGENIGTMYSITSKWTSFVAISENQPTQTVEEQKMNHYKALFDEIDIDELLNNFSEDEYSSSGSSSIISYDARQSARRNSMGLPSTYSYPAIPGEAFRVLEPASGMPILAPTAAQSIPPPLPLGARLQPNFSGNSAHGYRRMPSWPNCSPPCGYAMQRMSHPQPAPDPKAELSSDPAPLISGQSLAYPQSPSNEATEANDQPEKDLQASEESDWSYLTSDRKVSGGSRYGRPPPIPAPVSRAAPARPPAGMSLSPGFMDGGQGARPALRECSLDEKNDEPKAPHPVGAPISQHVSNPVQIEPQGSEDIIAAGSLRVRSKEVPRPRPWEDQDSNESRAREDSVSDDIRLATRERVQDDSSPAFSGADFPLYPSNSHWREAERSERTRADTEYDGLSNSPSHLEGYARKDYVFPSARRFDDFASEDASDDGETFAFRLPNAIENTSPCRSPSADENGHVVEPSNSRPSSPSQATPMLIGHIPPSKPVATGERLCEKVHQFKESAQAGVAHEPMVTPNANRGIAIPAAVIKPEEPQVSDDSFKSRLRGRFDRSSSTRSSDPLEFVFGKTSKKSTIKERTSVPAGTSDSIVQHTVSDPPSSTPQDSAIPELSDPAPPGTHSDMCSGTLSEVSEVEEYSSAGWASRAEREVIPGGPKYPTYRALPIPRPVNYQHPGSRAPGSDGKDNGAMSATYIPAGSVNGLEPPQMNVYSGPPLLERYQGNPLYSFDWDDGAEHNSISRDSSESLSSQSNGYGPLDWQFAMECQDGQGLFDLGEKGPSLYLHFCSETAVKIGPKISALLHNSTTPEQEGDAVSARLLDTLMMIECYKTHRAQEEDTWDLMMERAWDAVISVLGLSDEEETLEELAGRLRGAMMHAHYVAATGVKDSEKDEDTTGTTRCPACDAIWRTTRQFFCPFDHESDGVDEFSRWDDFWRHQVDEGHVVCAQEVIYE